MGLRPLEIFQLFQRGDRLYTSESAVYRRQILTYKDGPHAERVNILYLLFIWSGVGVYHMWFCFCSVIKRYHYLMDQGDIAEAQYKTILKVQFCVTTM